MNIPTLIAKGILTLETFYDDMKTHKGIEIANLDSNISSLQSQMNNIIIPDYTDDTRKRNNSITSFQTQIKGIITTDYTSEISNIYDSITNLQSQIDSLTIFPDYSSEIIVIQEEVNSLQNQIDNIPNYTSDIIKSSISNR
jgi:hypothetical protein